MKFRKCDKCNRKIYQGDWAYTNAYKLWCSENCMLEALMIEEFPLQELDCTDEDDAE
jgi:hypothetical protein